MIITEETKQRFIEMLKNRQIIVVQYRRHQRSSVFKFIGTNDCGRWDFTPCVADMAGIEYNGELINENLSIVGKDAVDVITKAVKNFACGGDWMYERTYHEIYEKTRDLITTFYI